MLRAEGALVLGTLACGLGLLWARSRYERVAVALVVALAAGSLGLARELERAERHRPSRPHATTVEATLARVARSGGGIRIDLTDAAAADPSGPPVPARISVRGPPSPDDGPALESLAPGARVRVRLHVKRPGSLRNPGGRSGARRLARAGVGAVARLAHPALFARLPGREGWRPLFRWHRLRADAGARLAASGDGGALLRALTFGERGDLPTTTRDAFVRAGLSHLLAVSGLHLGLVAALVYGCARRVLTRSARLAARRDVRGLALGPAVAAAVAYAFLAGFGVPVRRALVLLLATAAALARGRPGRRAEPIAAAAIAVLAAEPGALFLPGPQLSFAASAALLSATSGAAGSRLADAVRASATALAATAPIAALQLGTVAPFALLANVVAVPFTALVLLPASLLAGVAAMAPGVPGSEQVIAIAAGLAGACLAAVELVATRLPAAEIAPRPALVGLVASAGLALCALCARGTRTRAALALAIGAVLFRAAPAPVPPTPPRLVAFEVGQADATLVQGHDAAVLIDAGSVGPGTFDAGRRVVLPALRALGVTRLDRLIVSHADRDHRGGAPAVLAGLPVGAVWLPHGAHADRGFAALRAVARAQGVPVVEVGAGTPPIRLGDLRLTPLWPPPGHRAGTRNDASLVVRIDAPAVRVLLPGDLTADAEAALLASGADLAAEVLKLPHHGSRTSSSASFLAAVRPRVAIASAPCGGRFAMPHAVVLDRVGRLGASVWWTGRDGAVLVALRAPLTAWGFGDREAPGCEVSSAGRRGQIEGQ